jgi:photosystem II stability/assembly factor-like uncharacterized protein
MIVVCIESKAQSPPIAWEPTNSGNWEVRVLRSTNNDIVFAGTNFGLRKSTDEGTTWRDCTDSQMQNDIKDIYVSGSGDIWAGTKTGLFLSSDAGNTWARLYTSDTASEVRRVIMDKSGEIFISVQDSSLSGSYRSVFISQDTGRSWMKINDGIIGLSRINSFLTDTSGMVYALAGSGLIDYDILYSWDSLHQIWSSVYDFPPSVVVNSIRTHGGNIFVAATGDFMMISSDGGVSWVCGGLYYNNCVSLDLFSDSTIVVGTTWNGAYVSSDLGNTWNQDTMGLPHNPLVPPLIDPILSLCHNRNGRSFAGMRDWGVYRSTQSGTNVEEEESNRISPRSFSLLQNYPNPFNPTTTIVFDLASRERVVLTIYDILGRDIETLLNEVFEPGRHEVRWNASGISGGVYLCRISTHGYSLMRPMVLLR